MTVLSFNSTAAPANEFFLTHLRSVLLLNTPGTDFRKRSTPQKKNVDNSYSRWEDKGESNCQKFHPVQKVTRIHTRCKVLWISHPHKVLICWVSIDACVQEGQTMKIDKKSWLNTNVTAWDQMQVLPTFRTESK